MGGKREVELETRTHLLQWLHLKLTSHTANSSLKFCTCIAVCIAKSCQDSHIYGSFTLLLPSLISTSAPNLAPTITNTDMHVYIWMFP